MKFFANRVRDEEDGSPLELELREDEREVDEKISHCSLILLQTRVREEEAITYVTGECECEGDGQEATMVPRTRKPPLAPFFRGSPGMSAKLGTSPPSSSVVS